MPDEIQPPEPSAPSTPPEQLAPQVGTPPEPSPYDTTSESTELEALQNELAQSEAGLEANFAKYASEQITPELEDLFYEDKEAFLIQLQKIQNQFYQDNIVSKQARVGDLQQQISQKQMMGEIDQARASFESESGADVNELLQFYEDFIPNAAKRELDKLPPKEFFAQLYQIYQTQTNPQGAGGEPPSRIAGNAAPSSNLDYNADLLPTERY
ncbi:hypothetical protein [Helicobacter sp.]|uniref:hypothetical protein n=1 Tax=Helicobacter sp. TaxID=218 RepID=UPI0038909BB0